jgi:hypothetical protein
VKYGCLKITRCTKDIIMIGTQGSTWDTGDKGDNTTWNNS